MNILCDQCGEKILPLSSFCIYCGAESPRITQSALDFEKPDSPVYCPSCGNAAPDDSLFCPLCGKCLFDFPDAASLFCPLCNTKNRVSAKFCSSCGESFSDWFAMKGKIADKRGIKKNLTLFESMNNSFYHFISSKSLTIGYDASSDIRIVSPWVSGRHAFINLDNLILQDLNSTNGTYINRSPERIDKEHFSDISEFNISGVFTFLVKKFKNVIIFRLTAILDEAECKKLGNADALEELRNHYFILLTGDSTLYVRRTDGNLDSEPITSEPYYKISFQNKYFYFFDNSMTTQKLITHSHSLLPVNWKIILEGL